MIRDADKINKKKNTILSSEDPLYAIHFMIMRNGTWKANSPHVVFIWWISFISLILFALCLTADHFCPSPFTPETAHLYTFQVFSVDNLCPPEEHLFSNTQAHQ
jgi:hypothetical protein